ncbi:type II toxin-antitoxin system HicA family toxin [Selenomonas dianae]|uniref:Type II toxin-antitoxin system HicA family toxin n=1 Tax=Selenomonas dianae TaxID=135079 RepID=A0ABN0SUC7_9FIRM|nr:type II toxin-antitoxin system HicA family toxin [Selenomonas dianae]WLD83129.1 type II toxin-antitoxin system HicA family toxin [Selenomonas dianae]
MPRKVRDLLCIIKADGWKLVAQRGSHRQFKHPTKPGRVTISGHRESDDVSPDIEKSILTQAGLLDR